MEVINIDKKYYLQLSDTEKYVFSNYGGDYSLSLGANFEEVYNLDINLPAGFSIDFDGGEGNTDWPEYTPTLGITNHGGKIRIDMVLGCDEKDLGSEENLKTFIRSVKANVHRCKNFKVKSMEYDDSMEMFFLHVYTYKKGRSYKEIIDSIVADLQVLIAIGRQNIANSIFEIGFIDENEFREKIVFPLLKKMNFKSVKNLHGTNEFGKDFIVTENNNFDGVRYVGIQAKNGKVRGKSTHDINDLTEQVLLGFRKPYFDIDTKSKHYLSEFIIVCSENFTDNAIDILKTKIPQELWGSIHFWDKTKIVSLMKKFKWD